MTIDRLKFLVGRIANQAFCRYWLLYNYPNEPAEIAVEVIDREGWPVPPIDYLLEEPGFLRLDDGSRYMFKKEDN